jgi:GntR family transcriptional regulator/GntR family frlABCD operon transcriptional regulator
MISKQGNIPHYKKLYELLRKQIEENSFTEGDLLPSENELCSLHNLTRPTVRHALDALVNEGYIKKHKGKGSIVCGPPKEIGILSIYGTTLAVGKKNLLTSIISKPRVQAWEEPFFFELSDREKEFGCIKLERLRLVNDKPVFSDINFLPNINLPRFCSRNFENKSLFDILRKKYQIEVRGGEQKFKAITASKQISEFLQIRQGAPVLHLMRKIETNRPGYYFYSSLICNTKDYMLSGSF